MTENSLASRGAASALSVSSLVRQPAFWIYLIVVIAGLAVMISRLALISADPPVSLAIWVGVVIQTGALLLWGWLILPRRRARPSTVLASVLIGLSFAPAASILLLNVCELFGANRTIAAAFVEEPVKAAAVVIVLLMLRPALRGPVDGLIIGFFVGFGFAVIEDVLYTAGASTAQAAWLLVVTRAITQLGGHALWTAVIGAALAYVILSAGRRWGLVLGAFAFAILLHLTWNTVGVLAGGLISIAVTLVVVAITIVGFFRVRRWSVDFENRAHDWE